MFVNCYGKSIVDGHFGLLSRWLQVIEVKNKVTSIDILVQLLKQKLIDSEMRYKNIYDKLNNIIFLFITKVIDRNILGSGISSVLFFKWNFPRQFAYF